VSEGSVSQEAAEIRRVTRLILREPFSRQTRIDLGFLLLGAILAVAGAVVVLVLSMLGVFLAITVVGLAFLGFALKAARGLGRWQRQLALLLLGEVVSEPEPSTPRPGFFGWLKGSLTDRASWRAMGYLALKVPLAIFGVFIVGALWIRGLSSIIDVFLNGSSDHVVASIIFGIALVLAAPWAARVLVYVDRFLMQLLLGPDPVAARVQSLEIARARTVDSSAATLRKIERDLHDGTQAQLIALAMRLGMAKEQLHAKRKDVDLAKVRELVDLAHLETKEIIVELRDLTRGIHPPALDVGLEGALTTLAARSSIPTEVSVMVPDRPTPSIEAIAYFCVAELLANVAKHAQAGHAWVSCTERDQLLHIEVRDDGVGGAHFSSVGSSSSGLGGLAERALAVDGRLEIQSPQGGPTTVVVELPMHA